MVSLVTMATWGPAYPRVARWLGAGLRSLDIPADIVTLDAPANVSMRGSTRVLGLGVGRARSAVPALTRYLRATQPRLTLATPGSIGLVALVAGGLSGCAVVPWVVTIPRLDAADEPARLRPLRRVAPFVYRAAPRVACVSEAVREALIEDFGGHIPPTRIVVVPNPIDADEIRATSSPAVPPHSGLRLCSVGRLCNAKGFDVLIEALRLARPALGDGWEALIIGEGPLEADLRRQIQNAGLQANVHLTGHIDNPYPLMASADIAVQPSRWEGFGIAMAEMLCLGVPLLTTTRVGDLHELLADLDGAVPVPADDAWALAQALLRLAGDEELRRRIGDDEPRRMERFAPERVAQVVLGLATEVAESARRSRNRG